ncbi:hypothetical protein [Sphingomonas sp.]|uniref:hypothetical protein n=1 Tax=Sphingomonas sp. TaxID=28214 RepID=UPI0035BC1C10
MATLLNMTRDQWAGRAMLMAFLFLWIEMAFFARNLNLTNLSLLILPAVLMAVPTWAGATMGARAGSSITRGVAAVAASIVFILSAKAAYDIITSESSTAGIAFFFWPIIAAAVLGLVVAVAAALAWLLERRSRD